MSANNKEMQKSMEIVRADSNDESFIEFMHEFSPVPSRKDKINDFGGEVCDYIRSSDRKVTHFSSCNIESIENYSESYQNLNTDQIVGLRQEIAKLEERLALHLNILTQKMDKTSKLIKYIQLLEVRSDEKKKDTSKTKRGCGWGQIFRNFFIF